MYSLNALATPREIRNPYLLPTKEVNHPFDMSRQSRPILHFLYLFLKSFIKFDHLNTSSHFRRFFLRYLQYNDKCEEREVDDL